MKKWWGEQRCKDHFRVLNHYMDESVEFNNFFYSNKLKTKPKNKFPKAPRAFLPTMTSTPPTPPLPSMDDIEEPEQLTGFMQSATQADVVTDANDFDEVPIRNQFTVRIVEGKKHHNRSGQV